MEKHKEETFIDLENLTGYAKEYVDMRIDSFKLRMVENLSILFSKIVYALLLILLLGVATAFMASALSWYLGDLLNSRAAGALITAAIFILLSIIVVIKRKKLLIDSMVKMFIPMFFEHNNLKDNR